MYQKRIKTPVETIEFITELLAKNNIDWQVIEKRNFENVFYSIRIELSKFPGIGANGKGVSEELAMASGLAELMERLQSGILLGNRFGIYRFDNKRPGENISNENNPLLESYCLYENIATGEKRHLNDRKINIQCQSNGVAAGNIREEAIIQGCCEIFERYAIGEIFNKNTRCPLLNNEIISDASLKKYISIFENNGYKVHIFDATLRNRVPVLMVMLVDVKNGTYNYSFGSAISFEGALERCFSEIVQGCDQENFKNAFKHFELDNNQLSIGNSKIYRTADALYPICFTWVTTSEISKKIPTVFSKTDVFNDEYKKLLQILKRNHFECFVKNFSYLGFPTYRTYIQGCTELHYLTDEELSIINDFDNIAKKIMKLPQMEDAELRKLVEELIYINQKEFIKSSKIKTAIFRIIADQKVDLCEVNVTYLIMSILMKLHDWNNAKIYHFNLLNEYSYLKGNELFLGIGIYIEEMILGMSLKRIYGSNKRVLSDNTNDYLYMTFEKDDYLNMIYYPTCPSCNECKFKKSCKFNEWIKTRKKMFFKERDYEKNTYCH